MEEPRAEKDGGEREGGYDAEREIVEFRERRQQGRSLEMGLNEIVTRPGGCASGRNRLPDRRLGGRGRNWAGRLALHAR